MQCVKVRKNCHLVIEHNYLILVAQVVHLMLAWLTEILPL